jgi:hypothetical protein
LPLCALPLPLCACLFSYMSDSILLGNQITFKGITLPDTFYSRSGRDEAHPSRE